MMQLHQGSSSSITPIFLNRWVQMYGCNRSRRPRRHIEATIVLLLSVNNKDGVQFEAELYFSRFHGVKLSYDDLFRHISLAKLNRD